jgi:hypothetical protein
VSILYLSSFFNKVVRVISFLHGLLLTFAILYIKIQLGHLSLARSSSMSEVIPLTLSILREQEIEKMMRDLCSQYAGLYIFSMSLHD